ncbi:MAG: hypothetical protein JRH08_11340 [Deltaproteobacteria bacterium]|nr:hypothetical protein [Deltaproteobacteria bacterium]MBW1930535.1 hypothetical protein [Deltaproteobacteria bacterium]MBW2026168.1 hypothetical protein [Deltaproteobacteria bacterium]MBW2126266.1 hypothetical protein [Deltaproteobacteria bacterium]
MSGIEEFPFFRTLQGKHRAVIDVKAFEKWPNELDVDLLTDEDVKDRRDAFEELEKGEALDLQAGMKKW